MYIVYNIRTGEVNDVTRQLIKRKGQLTPFLYRNDLMKGVNDLWVV